MTNKELAIKLLEHPETEVRIFDWRKFCEYEIIEVQEVSEESETESNCILIAFDNPDFNEDGMYMGVPPIGEN